MSSIQKGKCIGELAEEFRVIFFYLIFAFSVLDPPCVECSGRYCEPVQINMEASPPSDHPDPIKYAVTHAILIAFCLAPIGMCIKRICCTPSVEGKGDSFWQRSFVAFMLLGCLCTFY